MQNLISFPPNLVETFADLEHKYPPEWVAASDPDGLKIGSGGGTANLLYEAWRKTGADKSFQEWLRESRKLMIHAGGQSRRLPAYASIGKILLPTPVFRWSRGQRLDQTLLDIQLPLYQRILKDAPKEIVAMVASGDVLIRSQEESFDLPKADIVCLGLWIEPEKASKHGVFFCLRENPETLDFFLQKPSPKRIREYAPSHLFLVDTGVWLFSEKALDVLMRKCDWDAQNQEFINNTPKNYELYAEFGVGMGSKPEMVDAEINSLSVAIMAIPKGEFYHFGSNRDLIKSSAALQNLILDQRQIGSTNIKAHPDMFIQNASFKSCTSDNSTIWVENSHIAENWKIEKEHIITGVPENDWTLKLKASQCLDLVPVGEDAFCVRPYHIDDCFKGPIGDTKTVWLGAPSPNWFAVRNISFSEMDIDPETDIQNSAIFPVISEVQTSGSFIQWLFDNSLFSEVEQAELKQQYLLKRKLSAMGLTEEVNLKRLYEQRKSFLHKELKPLAENYKRSIFHQLDLLATATQYAESSHELPSELPVEKTPLMTRIHDLMFRSAVKRQRQESDWLKFEENAFSLLRDEMIANIKTEEVVPVKNILDDQIIWGRSPIRLDLAGGWTDTPPYCLLHGGKVVNLAAEMNGQAPLQVFAKLSENPEIIIRSIDLGVQQVIKEYHEIDDYDQVGSGFAIVKAALALAGFLPEFQSGKKYKSLKEQLKECFDGGIELSLLSAVPKGSGLGTSSILAATVLGTLNEICDLKWDLSRINQRTLVLEQMLTTGGGWQDQWGGITQGLKLLETQAGWEQKPAVRWLPDHLFTNPVTSNCLLLYYTGITRIAKNILHEIVRGMFLNSHENEAILEMLGQHATNTAHVIQKNDWGALGSAIDKSWELNKKLDSGTNPPVIEEMLARIQDYILGAKLLGAGGGGYMFMMAKDESAALKIKKTLDENPPNPKARFVKMTLSNTGLQITRS